MNHRPHQGKLGLTLPGISPETAGKCGTRWEGGRKLYR